MNFRTGIQLSTLLFGIVLLCSCGPSAEEKARLASIQQAREDSIRIAAEIQTKRKIEQKRMLEDSLVQERTFVDAANNRLTYLQADLVAKRDRLEAIKQPQFLRTPAEREKEIRDQLILISALENEITTLSANIETGSSRVRTLEKALLKY